MELALREAGGKKEKEGKKEGGKKGRREEGRGGREEGGRKGMTEGQREGELCLDLSSQLLRNIFACSLPRSLLPTPVATSLVSHTWR